LNGLQSSRLHPPNPDCTLGSGIAEVYRDRPSWRHKVVRSSSSASQPWSLPCKSSQSQSWRSSAFLTVSLSSGHPVPTRAVLESSWSVVTKSILAMFCLPDCHTVFRSSSSASVQPWSSSWSVSHNVSFGCFLLPVLCSIQLLLLRSLTDAVSWISSGLYG
jgi:hypothetical protein